MNFGLLDNVNVDRHIGSLSQAAAHRARAQRAGQEAARLTGLAPQTATPGHGGVSATARARGQIVSQATRRYRNWDREAGSERGGARRLTLDLDHGHAGPLGPCETDLALRWTRSFTARFYGALLSSRCDERS